MEKVPLTAPALKDVAGPKAGDFPAGFQMPYTHFIRTAFLSRRDDLIDGAEIARQQREEAWDEGYETGGDDEAFYARGLSSDPGADEVSHSNPYWAES